MVGAAASLLVELTARHCRRRRVRWRHQSPHCGIRGHNRENSLAVAAKQPAWRLSHDLHGRRQAICRDSNRTESDRQSGSLSDVGGPKLPDAPSGQPPATAQTPSISAPKPEVQSSGFGEPKQPSNAPVQPSPTTQVPIAAQDLADRKSLAPVIIAMNVVLPFLSIGILIWLLKSAE